MKRITGLLPLVIMSFLISCGSSGSKQHHTIYVSIAPLKYVVEQIADPGTIIEVLVPETSSPESYEPTPKQIQELTSAPVYVSTGLIDFELTLEEKIRELSPNTIYLNLSQGIEVMPGDCGHTTHVPGIHYHSVDPHIWLSPKIMTQMGYKTAHLLSQLDPDKADIYKTRADQLAAQIESLDHYIKENLKDTKRRKFAIGHTSLTYFAKDYGLEQIAVETDGKEPSAKAIKHLIDSLQQLGVKAVFYQQQNSDATVKAVARELPGGRAMEYDPLAEDWLTNMYRLADSLRVVLND